MPTIVVDFQSSGPASLVSIQIDAWELIHATTYFEAHTAVVFQMSSYKNHVAVPKEHSTTIVEVRTGTLASLADLYLRKLPEYYGPRPINVHVNGFGILIRALLEATPVRSSIDITLEGQLLDHTSLRQMLDDRTQELCGYGMFSHLYDRRRVMWTQPTLHSFVQNLHTLVNYTEWEPL
jgi:hypothetical protein